MFDAERLQVIAKRAKRLEGVDEGKSEEEDETERRPNDEGDDLVVRYARGEESNGDKCRTEEQESEIGTPRAAHIDIANRVAYKIDRDDIDEGRQQGDGKQC